MEDERMHFRSFDSLLGMLITIKTRGSGFWIGRNAIKVVYLQCRQI